MKRVMKIFIIVLIGYVLFKLGMKNFKKGHNINYEMKDKDRFIQINEVAVFHEKKIEDHYQFTVTMDDKKFRFITNQTFQKKSHVLKEIKYFKNSHYECIYPIFENNLQVTDILCERENIIYHYHDLKGKSGELDKFAKELATFGYHVENWYDDTKEEKKKGAITLYPKNMIKNHYIGIDSYSGIHLVNYGTIDNVINAISIFKNDQYEKTISGNALRYYIVANYNETYNFNQFFIVDLVTGEQKTLKSPSYISFDSYIEGTIEDSIYLLDRSSKKQYQINLKKNQIIEIGNEKIGMKYYENGKWNQKKITEAITSDIYFDYSIDSKDQYERIDYLGNEKFGYYYFYKKVENGYEVYRSFAREEELKTYLFKTSNIDEIKYLNDYIYYKEDNFIKYYHDMTGVRTLLSNTEFEFNQTLNYYIYYNNKK